MLIKEFCAENFTLIPAAIKAGAQRIELCDNLSVGGTTPSFGVLKQTIAYCHTQEIPVMAMIRPRGGNFVYSAAELEIALTDLATAQELGVHGVVFGALTAANKLDYASLDKLLAAAAGLEVTFHMAFDALSFSDQLSAIDWLSERGVTRILTHGGKAGTPIAANFPRLKQLLDYAQERLILLPGGGITSQNAALVAQTLHVGEVHGTKIVPLPDTEADA